MRQYGGRRTRPPNFLFCVVIASLFGKDGVVPAIFVRVCKTFERGARVLSVYMHSQKFNIHNYGRELYFFNALSSLFL